MPIATRRKVGSPEHENIAVRHPTRQQDRSRYSPDVRNILEIEFAHGLRRGRGDVGDPGQSLDLYTHSMEVVSGGFGIENYGVTDRIICLGPA